MRGLGVSIPDRCLTNEALEKGMPWLRTSAQWISEHTGILQRHVADSDKWATDLGYEAAKEALELSGMEPEDIEMVLFATNTNPQIYPAGASRIQGAFGKDERGRLRMYRAGALDLQMGCASWLGAMGMAMGMIRGGTFSNILVVGADVATRMVDWSDRDAILLGDAGTACVLSKDPRPSGVSVFPQMELLSFFSRTDPLTADAIYQKGPLNPENDPFNFLGRDIGVDLEPLEARKALYPPEFFGGPEENRMQFFKMDGRKVYRFVRGTVPREGYLEVLRSAGLVEDAPEELGLDSIQGLDEVKDKERRMAIASYLASKVDCFVPHSANLSLNQELAEGMKIPFERMYITLHKYGNTSAASVGLSLYEGLRQKGRYQTLTKRDGQGKIKVPSREITVKKLEPGMNCLLLSFGAGNSWNSLMARVHE